MKQFDLISEQTIHSFVDNELDTAGKQEFLTAMKKDESLRNRVERIRHTKTVVQFAFEAAEPPHREPHQKRWWHDTFRIVASLAVLTICFGMGTLGYKTAPLWTTTGEQSLQTSQHKRVILHIGESNMEQFSATLAAAESYLRQHENGDVQVEVVANAGGLDLLRTGTSPYEEKVLALIQSYENLHFIACANSVRNLRRLGTEPHFIGDIETKKSAVDHIVGRVLEGWTYIKMDRLPEV